VIAEAVNVLCCGIFSGTHRSDRSVVDCPSLKWTVGRVVDHSVPLSESPQRSPQLPRREANFRLRPAAACRHPNRKMIKERIKLKMKTLNNTFYM